MILDFHTHVFPDRIAEKTIQHLSKKGGIPPFSDGSMNGLLTSLTDAKVDIAINLPVLTSPAQFDSVNRFAEEINARPHTAGPRVISFAGIHPMCEDLEGKMEWIRERGFLGVKLHPDYQETFINDQRYVRILRAARELDLIVVTHAGYDVAYPDSPIRCTPPLVRDLLEKAPHSKLVLAHMGGNTLWDRVLEELCGADVYMDTSYVLPFIGKETFLEMVEKHGEDRILFGSDSPWNHIGKDVEILRSFELEKTTEEKIFSENGKALLGI